MPTNNRTGKKPATGKGNRKKSVGTKPRISKISTSADYSMNTQYAARVTDSKGRTWAIPVTKNGKVEKETLMARLATHDPTRRKRDYRSDLRQKNRNVMEFSDDPKKIVEWWADPGKMDIQGVDTPGNQVYSNEGVKYSSKSMEKAQGKIAIIGGTKTDRKKIRQTLNDDFSAAELNRLTKEKDLVMIVGSTHRQNTGGYYRPRTSYDLPFEDICYRPNSSEDTIVHEVVHALRTADLTRTGIAKTPYPITSRGFRKEIASSERERLRPAEEAATVAESNVRTKQKGIPSGYYSYIPNGRGKEYENYDKDRKTLLGRKKTDTAETVKSQKGNAAINTVNSRFQKTEISKIERA